MEGYWATTGMTQKVWQVGVFTEICHWMVSIGLAEDLVWEKVQYKCKDPKIASILLGTVTWLNPMVAAKCFTTLFITCDFRAIRARPRHLKGSRLMSYTGAKFTVWPWHLYDLLLLQFTFSFLLLQIPCHKLGFTNHLLQTKIGTKSKMKK